MIFLTPSVPYTNSVVVSGLAWFTGGHKSTVIAETETYYTGNLNMLPPILIGYATDQDYNEFENVELVVSSRFKRNGIRYVSDGEVAINFDVYLQCVNELLS